MVILLIEIRKLERGSLCEFSFLFIGYLSDYIKGKIVYSFNNIYKNYIFIDNRRFNL